MIGAALALMADLVLAGPLAPPPAMVQGALRALGSDLTVVTAPDVAVAPPPGPGGVLVLAPGPDTDPAALAAALAVAAGARVFVAEPPGAPPGTVPLALGPLLADLAARAGSGDLDGATAPDILAPDGRPGPKGSYAAALAVAGAVTGQPVTDLPPRLTRTWESRAEILSPDQARAMQRAVQAMLDAPLPAPLPAQSLPAAAEIAEPAPAVAEGPPPGLTGITNPALGMNLAPVADWSVQQPFLDVMKTARPWIGHLPGQWGGWDHDDLAQGGWLGPGGWPRAVPPQLQAIATVVLNDLPAEARSTAGRYRVTWQGEGSLRIEGRARVVSERPGEILFDFDPGPGAVIVTITETDPARRGRPIRDIRIIPERHRAAAGSGEIFNPDWIARIAGADPLRFMDWLATNGATLASAEDRPRPQDYTWARQGVPVEVVAALANRLRADPWITLPHTAEPDLIADWAAVFRDSLDPGLRVWVEFSNEMWNWVFPQAHWAQDGARREWGGDAAWVEYATLAAARAMQTWTRAYGPSAGDRVVRVVGVQTGWLGLEDQMLGSPRVRAALGADPAGFFDAYAVTGYFGGMLGDPERLELLKSWLAEGPAAAEARALTALADGTGLPGPEGSLDHLLTVLLPHHAARARDWGLDLVMYEGGTHVAGLGPVANEADVTAFFTALNYTPGMAALHDRLIAGWAALGAGPFVHYYDVGGPGWHGSWGALRHLWDENPRWQAVAGGCGGC